MNVIKNQVLQEGQHQQEVHHPREGHHQQDVQPPREGQHQQEVHHPREGQHQQEVHQILIQYQYPVKKNKFKRKPT